MNNEVYDDTGLIGYKCKICGEVYDTMWDNVCNKCRREEERYQEILKSYNGDKMKEEIMFKKVIKTILFISVFMILGFFLNSNYVKHLGDENQTSVVKYKIIAIDTTNLK